MPTSPHAAEPTLLEPKGPAVTVSLCAFGLILLLSGTGAATYCAATAITGYVGSTGAWAVLAGAFLLAALAAWIGLSVILTVRRDRAATIQLARCGVDAAALVLSVALVPGGEAKDEIHLHVRISGPGFEEFESKEKLLSERFKGVAQGAVLPARVDPSDLVFALDRLRAARPAHA
ncbi:hypothetical protein [Streptomyces sp. NPDC048295]|uniref:hypothetical protein n=1 Tax=Streptomyces sp. NPDC048295 TaxID=3154617 RepID=UPI00342E0A34